MKKLMAVLMAMLLAFPMGICARGEEKAAGHVAAGDRHAVLLFDDGTCAAVGDNAFGQCDVYNWKNVAAITAGSRHTVALLADGTCAAVGDNAFGQCEVYDWKNVTAIAAGARHTVALFADGACAAVGAVSVPDSDSFGEEEIAYRADLNPCAVDGWTDVASIAAGGEITVALTRAGKVLAAGDTDNYIFNDSYTDENGEEIVYGIDTWTGIRQLAVGPESSMIALFNDGTARTSGFFCPFEPYEASMCSECHPGIDRFVALSDRSISHWTGVVRVFSCGAGESDANGACGVTFGLRADGTLCAAGDDTFAMTEMTAWTDIVDLAVGNGFAVGVRADGTLLYAGKGDCLLPRFVQLSDLTDLSLYADGEGAPYAIGVKPDGSLTAWSEEEINGWYDERIDGAAGKRAIAAVACAPDGYIALGQNGVVQTDSLRFAALNGLENIVQIAAGGTLDGDFALALSASGEVTAAGDIAIEWTNAKGIAAGKGGAACVFADGTVAVAGALAGAVDCSDWTGIAAVSVGENHIAGLKNDGTCVAAGENADGRCDVGAWAHVAALAAGARHTLALFDDGTCAAVGGETATQYDELVFSDALNVSKWKQVVRVRAADGVSVGLTATGETLIAGLNALDLREITQYRLWSNDRRRDDAPLDENGGRSAEILAEIAAARADYAAVRAFADRRSAETRAILAAHPEYDDVWGEYAGLRLYRQDGLFGFLTPDGEVALEAAYEYIDRKPSGGMYALSRAGQYGFCDLTGALRVPCQYDKTNGYDGYGYARVGMGGWLDTQDEKWIDRDGNAVAATEEAYSALIANLPKPADPVIGYASAEKASMRGGDEGSRADDENDFDGDFEAFRVGSENGYGSYYIGYCDTDTGKAVFPAFFDAAYDFEDGIASIILCDCNAYINEDFELLSGLDIALP